MDTCRHRLLELLEESGANLHALFVRLTLREDVAEQLLQGLFSALPRSRRFERAANSRFHAHRAAIHLAFDWRGRQKRRVVPLEETPDSQETPSGEPVRREDLEEVLDAIGRLRKRGRDVIVMRYIEQRSYDDIARRLGMTSHHISTVCHRAREQLKAILNRDSAAPYGAGLAPAEYNERKLLRRLQALSQIEPNGELTDRAVRNVRGAVEQLDGGPSGASRPHVLLTPRRLFYAAAVMLLMAVIVAVVVEWNGRSAKPAPPEVVKQQSPAPKPVPDTTPVKSVEKPPRPAEITPRAAPEIEQELRQIFALGDSGDIDGLLGVLAEGSLAGKLAATSCLMEVGDERAIGPLEELSAAWYGENETNPFAAAAAQIRQRLAQGPDKDGGASPPEPAPVVATVADPNTTKPPQTVKPGGAFRGYVLDAVGNTMAGAAVGVKSWAVELVGAANDEGCFSIAMPANRTALASPVVIWATLPNQPDFMGWTLLQSESDSRRYGLELIGEIPGNPGTIDVSPDYKVAPAVESTAQTPWCVGAADVVVVMEPAGRMTGRVTEVAGAAIAGAAITVQFELAGKDDARYPYGRCWSTRGLTDEHGAYHVGYLPRLWKGCGWRVSAAAEGFVGQSETLTIDGSLDVMTVDLQLYRAGVTVRGVLMDSDGVPLPDRLIFATVNGRRYDACSVKSAADGRFELKGCPDAEGLSVFAELSRNPYAVGTARHDSFESYPDLTADAGYEPGRTEYEVEMIAAPAD